MLDIKDFYILNLPIETDIGGCHFLKVKDYPKYFVHLNTIAITKEEIIAKYIVNNDITSDVIEYLKSLSLYEMITCSNDVLKMYKELFTYVFRNENIFSLVNIDNFDLIRKLIMDMNCVKEKKINPNPEIQAWIEKSRQFEEQANGDSISFSDIVSCVARIKGYREVNRMSLYQLYFDFTRETHIRNYETMTLFATVSTEKLNIENWCKHIDLFVEKQIGLSSEEYGKHKQGLGF